MFLLLHAAPPAAPVRTDADRLEDPILVAVNDVRRAHGLAPLRASAPLAGAAAAHAVSMGREGYFAHESGDGSVFWKRVKRWYPSQGYWRWSAGENLLWKSPDVTPAEVVEMWMNSPAHREVLLSPTWREVGIAAVHVTDAPGTFHGRDATIVAADFGARDRA